MSITQYNGIIERTKASITVSVQRVDRAESGVFVPAMLPNSREYFSSVQTAEYAYPDVFDHTATFFHIKDNASIAPLYSCGFEDLVYMGGAGDNRYETILFPTERSVSMSYRINAGTDAQFRCSYKLKDNVFNINYRKLHAVGLFSERVYKYRNADGVLVSALLSPAIYHNDNSDKFALGSYYVDKTYPSLPYPAYSERLYSLETDSAEAIAAFEEKVAFFTEFWSGMKFQYYATVVSSIGGSVTPGSFFASQNDFKTFTVTPDSHHAIHSVTAYNTDTNTPIPLTESAMNLLTGSKNYTFVMPAANVRIIVEFRSIEVSIPVTVSYKSVSGKIYTTAFNLQYDDSSGGE